MIQGTLTFQAGDERFDAQPGDIVIVPPHVPHKLTNDGPTAASSSASTPTAPSTPIGSKSELLQPQTTANRRL